MNEPIQFLIEYGYILLFVWIFAEQIGLPVPSEPLLLTAGALAGKGFWNFPLTFLLAVIASSLADTFWYLIGRKKGGSVLSSLCRISLNPDSCVRHTVDIFSRYGAKSLLVAKFIPGIRTIAPPLSGILRMHFFRFLLFDALGAWIWVAVSTGLGYIFRDQIIEIIGLALRLGSAIMGVVIGALAAYIAWKYIQRRRFLNRLRIARITPEALKEKLDAGEDLLILDVRHVLEFEAEPQTIPGALYLSLERLEKDPPAIPGDREVILYCN